MIGIETGARSADEGEGAGTARPGGRHWRSSAACWCWAPGDNTLRLCPPLVITRDQCDFALDTLEAVPRTVSRASVRILDVGCGIHKQPGAIGIDRNPASRADVLVRPRPLSVSVRRQLLRPR